MTHAMPIQWERHAVHQNPTLDAYDIIGGRKVLAAIMTPPTMTNIHKQAWMPCGGWRVILSPNLSQKIAPKQCSTKRQAQRWAERRIRRHLQVNP